MEESALTLGTIVQLTGGIIQTGPFGSQLHATDYVAEGTPLIMPVNLGDNVIQENGIARVGNEDVRRLGKHRLRAGDIVFSRRGDVGRRSIVREAESGWLCGTGCLAVRFGRNLRQVNPEFVAMCVGTTRPQQWLQDNAVGGTMPNLNTSILARLPLWLPSRKEQDQAVSAITTIADTALTLERLIAKKRAIKQGMMQELLTGRTRLPGFDQPWRKTTLGEISRIKTGSRNNQDKREDGEYPFFVRSAQVERIDTYSYDCEAILVPGEGGIGSIFHYVNGKFEVHQRVYTVSDFVAGVSGKFVFYFMHQFFGQHAMENSVKATVDSLRLPTFKSFQLYLPNQHSEQETIVRILDEVDAEIDALEQSLRITRGIKQGMMQELLTGRTRLPVEEVAQ